MSLNVQFLGSGVFGLLMGGNDPDPKNCGFGVILVVIEPGAKILMVDVLRRSYVEAGAFGLDCRISLNNDRGIKIGPDNSIFEI